MLIVAQLAAEIVLSELEVVVFAVQFAEFFLVAADVAG